MYIGSSSNDYFKNTFIILFITYFFDLTDFDQFFLILCCIDDYDPQAILYCLFSRQLSK